MYLESPVPVFLGITSLPEGHEVPPGQVVVDVDRNVVELNEEELARYHTLILPKMSQLNHDLLPHVERLESELGPIVVGARSGGGVFDATASACYSSSPMTSTRAVSPVMTINSVQPSKALGLSMRRYVHEQKRKRASECCDDSFETSEPSPQAERVRRVRAACASPALDARRSTLVLRPAPLPCSLPPLPPTHARFARRFGALVGNHVQMLVEGAVEVEDEREKEKGRGGKRFLEERLSITATVGEKKWDEKKWWEEKLGGEVGIAFMDRMMETQMYNGYAFDVKRKKKRKGRGRGGTEDADAATEFGSFGGGGGGEVPGILNKKTARTRGSTTFADNFHSRSSGANEFRNDLAGAREMTKEFERRYSSKNLRKKSVAMGVGLGGERLGGETVEVCKELGSKGIIVDLMEIMIRGGLTTTQESEALAGSASTEGAAEGGMWCNGRCEGGVVSEFCTMLCVQVWEERYLARNVCSPTETSASPERRRGASFLMEAERAGNLGGRRRAMRRPRTHDSTRALPHALPHELPHALPPALTRVDAVKQVSLGLTVDSASNVGGVGAAGAATIALSPASHAAGVVHALMKKRKGAARKKNAHVTIARWLKKCVWPHLKEMRTTRGVVRFQAVVRRVNAAGVIRRAQGVSIMASVDRHLRRRLDSDVKAEKDFDWLFRQSTMESEEAKERRRRVESEEEGSSSDEDSFFPLDFQKEGVIDGETEDDDADASDDAPAEASAEASAVVEGVRAVEDYTNSVQHRVFVKSIEERRKSIEATAALARGRGESEPGASGPAVTKKRSTTEVVTEMRSGWDNNFVRGAWDEVAVEEVDFGGGGGGGAEAEFEWDDTFAFTSEGSGERVCELTEDGGGKMGGRGTSDFDSSASPPQQILFSVAEGRGGEEEEEKLGAVGEEGEGEEEEEEEEEEEVKEEENQSEGWNCPRCTLLNEVGVQVCEACEYREEDSAIEEFEEVAEVAAEEVGRLGFAAPRDRQATVVTRELAENGLLDEEEFLRRFKERLERGFVVKKHGRRGLPQWRVVFCDETQSTLFWRSPSRQELEDTGVDAGLEAISRLSFSEETDETDESVASGDGVNNGGGGEGGEEAGGRGRRSMSMMQSLKASIKGVRGKRMILFEDIEVVNTAGATDIMRESLRNGQVGGGNTQFGHMLISLVLHSGKTVGKQVYSRKYTLDLEVTSPTLYKLMTRGFTMCVEEANRLAEGRGRVLSARRRQSSVGL